MTNFFHIFIFHKKYPISSRISISLFDEQDVLWIRLWVVGARQRIQFFRQKTWFLGNNNPGFCLNLGIRFWII